jgi:hypothetical protein
MSVWVKQNPDVVKVVVVPAATTFFETSWTPFTATVYVVAGVCLAVVSVTTLFL